MATLDQFYPLVEPRVMGCPRPLIINELSLLLQDFFSFSRIWQQDITIPSVSQTSMPLVIPAPSGTRILETRRVKADDAFIQFRTQDALREWSPDWQTMVGEDPYFFTAVSQSTIWLVPLPGAPIPVVATCALTIAAGASASTVIPDEIFEEYKLGLAAGVTARLMMMPNKAWSSMPSAPAFAADYAADRRSARAAANLDFNGAPMRASFRRTF